MEYVSVQGLFLLFLFLLIIVILLIIYNGKYDSYRYWLQIFIYTTNFYICVNRVISLNETSAANSKKNELHLQDMRNCGFGLSQILSSSKGYDLFMRFLVSEFSTENLLFVTEYIQVKSILSLSNKEMRSLDLIFELNLPENIPIPKMILDLNLDLETIKRQQQHRKEKHKRHKKKLQKILDQHLMEKKRMGPNLNMNHHTLAKSYSNIHITSAMDMGGNSSTIAAVKMMIHKPYKSVGHEEHLQVPSTLDAVAEIKTDEQEDDMFDSVQIKVSPIIIGDQNSGQSLCVPNTELMSERSDISELSHDIPHQLTPKLHDSSSNLALNDHQMSSSSSHSPSSPASPSSSITQQTHLTMVVKEDDDILSYEQEILPDNTPYAAPFLTSLSSLHPIGVLPSVITPAVSGVSPYDEIQNIDERIILRNKTFPLILAPDVSNIIIVEDKVQESGEYKELVKVKSTSPVNRDRNGSGSRVRFSPVVEHSVHDIVQYSANTRKKIADKYAIDDIDINHMQKTLSADVKYHQHFHNMKKRRHIMSDVQHRKGKSLSILPPNSPSFTVTSSKTLAIRVRHSSALLKQKSRKFKKDFVYHMREASSSMAMNNDLVSKLISGNKHKRQYKVLDCASFVNICRILYFKYISVGVAPLEVNVSAATRTRCSLIFEKYWNSNQQRSRYLNNANSGSLNGMYASIMTPKKLGRISNVHGIGSGHADSNFFSNFSSKFSPKGRRMPANNNTTVTDKNMPSISLNEKSQSSVFTFNDHSVQRTSVKINVSNVAQKVLRATRMSSTPVTVSDVPAVPIDDMSIDSTSVASKNKSAEKDLSVVVHTMAASNDTVIEVEEKKECEGGRKRKFTLDVPAIGEDVDGNGLKSGARRLSKSFLQIFSNNRQNMEREQFAMTFIRSPIAKKNAIDPFNGNMRAAMTELLPPLEQAALELLHLLTDSLSRFKKTKACVKLFHDWKEKKDVLID